jgi:hypothetical protein
LNDEPLTIDLSGLKRAPEVRVSLNDMSGKIVGSYFVTGDKFEIRRTELPRKGFYIIEVNTGYGIERLKLLVE